jgi:thiamine biosynthesis lipoprotein
MSALPALAPASAQWSLWSSYAHLAVADGRTLRVARSVAEEVLARVDGACSRFRPDSDLSVANRHAGSWVQVDPLLLAAVRAALWAAEVTDGVVDPCLGRALVALGYDDDLAVVRRRLPGDRPVPVAATAAPRPGAWREIEMTDDLLLVPAGVALDLGATATSWAADVVARAVADATGCSAVVSLGGDVRVAGPAGAAPPEWDVRVAEAADDLQDPEHGTTVGVSGGLATSTTVVRRWRSGGTEHHHLLDPVTGWPAAAPYRTVTAAGSTCLGANAASTAAVVLGDRAPQWLAANGVAARLVAQDGTVTTVGPWPADPPSRPS